MNNSRTIPLRAHAAANNCVQPTAIWLRFILFILTAGLLIGCATHRPRSEQATPHSQRTERAPHSFSIGSSRKEVRADLSDSWLLVSASRPVSGWSRKVSPPAGGRAVRFESSHPGSPAEACDVYWIGHTNAPRMYYGIWLNCFYFDHDEKLIGFDRWVLD